MGGSDDVLVSGVQGGIQGGAPAKEGSAAEDEAGEVVMASRAPVEPTIGWMMSELERLGVHTRGHFKVGEEKTKASLLRMLKERGYKCR